VRDAYQVAKVRAAEAALMAQVPDGALMRRAAAGLESVCASLLGVGSGGVYGAEVVVFAGTGDNGGDALYAAARLAAAARRSPRSRPAGGSTRAAPERSRTKAAASSS